MLGIFFLSSAKLCSSCGWEVAVGHTHTHNMMNNTQDPKLSDTCAAAEKMLGLFPGKWVIYYPLISASKIGLKTASAAEAYFLCVRQNSYLGTWLLMPVGLVGRGLQSTEGWINLMLPQLVLCADF